MLYKNFIMSGFCCFFSDLLSSLKVIIIVLIITIIFFVILLPIILFLLRRKYILKRSELRKDDESQMIVAFFHPYCNAGGGGERVLWCAIKAIQYRYPSTKQYVYTGDLEACPEAILKRVKDSFNIQLDEDNISFIYLTRRKWVEAYMYPYFTLLGQSLGAIWLGLEALNKLQPDIYIDTMGYAFTLPLFKYVGNCKVACYVHYPTITSDMLKRVYSRIITHNNRKIVANSPFLTSAKVVYYKIFAKLYGLVGRSSDSIMVNSSWTEEHINELWQVPILTHRVYPPCDVEHLKKLERIPCDKIKIISIGQFRPEKDHPLQLRALYELRSIIKEELFNKVKLVIIGSCRNTEDETRVKDMKDLCKHLSLENNVEFKVNISYDELQRELQEGTIGLHSMWNEHFGIGVVECMAAGLIMVAHKSGGPLMDIVETSEPSKNGFLAITDQEYACAIAAVLYLFENQKHVISNAARASVDRFSGQEFEKSFLRALGPLFD